MHATQDCQSSEHQYASREGMTYTLPTAMQVHTSKLLSTSMHDRKDSQSSKHKKLPPPPPPHDPPSPPPPPPHVPPATHEDSHPRGPNIHPTVDWTAVNCARCGNVAGHYKYSESPGNRDKASWFLRVWDPDNAAWGKRSPYHRVVRCHIEPHPEMWISLNRNCCSDLITY